MAGLTLLRRAGMAADGDPATTVPAGAEDTPQMAM